MIVNKYYELQTIAPSVLGNTFKNIKLTKILNFQEAIKEDTSLLYVNDNVYNSISQNPIPDIGDMTFYVFENANGDKIILSNSWIQPQSIVELSKISLLTISVTNVTHEDNLIIQDMLRNLGFNNFSVTV